MSTVLSLVPPLAPAPGSAAAPLVTTQLDSPIGTLTLVARGGSLVGVYMPEHSPAPKGSDAWVVDDEAAPFPEARTQFAAYFAGERATFDLPLDPAGTAFQNRVWAELRAIPYGSTATYGMIAEAIGQPTAVRAVGLANGRNPLSIIVPCHRVVGSSGKLTGYAGGLERKQHLLDLERGLLAL